MTPRATGRHVTKGGYMKKNQSRLILVPLITLALATSAKAQEAPKPTQSPSELKRIATYFQQLNQELKSLGAARFQARLSFRDAKGHERGLLAVQDTKAPD